MSTAFAVRRRLPVCLQLVRYMGNKISPNAMRLNKPQRSRGAEPMRDLASRDWAFQWYTFDKCNYQSMLHQDAQIQHFLAGHFHELALISQAKISRSPTGVTVRLFCYNPDKVDLQAALLQKHLARVFAQTMGRTVVDPETNKRKLFPTTLVIREIPNPLLNADILAQWVVRVNTDRNRLQTIFDRLVALLPATPPVRSESSSAPLEIVGFRIQTSGRQSGQEMAETQTYRHSAVPTSRLDANIDYGTATLETRYGVVGAKVWIHFQQTGRMLSEEAQKEKEEEAEVEE